VLGRVCALTRDYPHGALRVTVAAPSSTLANARSHELQSELGRAGCDPARVGVDILTLGGDELEFAWLAY
jgi:hypothetical protein